MALVEVHCSNTLVFMKLSGPWIPQSNRPRGRKQRKSAGRIRVSRDVEREPSVTSQASKRVSIVQPSEKSSDTRKAEAMKRIRSELPDIPGHSSRFILSLDRSIPKCWVFVREN